MASTVVAEVISAGIRVSVDVLKLTNMLPGAKPSNDVFLDTDI